MSVLYLVKPRAKPRRLNPSSVPNRLFGKRTVPLVRHRRGNQRRRHSRRRRHPNTTRHIANRRVRKSTRNDHTTRTGGLTTNRIGNGFHLSLKGVIKGVRVKRRASSFPLSSNRHSREPTINSASLPRASRPKKIYHTGDSAQNLSPVETAVLSHISSNFLL